MRFVSTTIGNRHVGPATPCMKSKNNKGRGHTPATKRDTMEANKETLKKFVREQVEELNNLQMWNIGLISTSEIEPKLELLRRINSVFDLGIDKSQIRDWHNRTKQ